MADYQYLLCDIFTRDRLAELPLTSATYTDTLNEPGSLEGELALVQPDDVTQVLAADLRGRTAQRTIYVVRDGRVMWGGILWGIQADLAAGTAKLAAEGFHSLFRRRLLRDTKVYTGVDQADLAADLLADSQAEFNGDVGVLTPGGFSGFNRTRTYQAFERNWVGELVEDLAGVINGPDILYFHDFDTAGRPRTTFVTDSPPPVQTALVFDPEIQGEGEASVTEDATQICTAADMVGAGEGDIKLLSSQQNVTLFGVYPNLDALETHSTVTDVQTLDDHGQRRLARGSAPIVIPAMAVSPELEPSLGSYRVGAAVDVRGKVGWFSFSDRYRVTQRQVRVDANGGERVVLSFALDALFQD